MARSSSSRPLRTRGSKRAPSGVSWTTRPLRLNSVAPRYSSSERICMLTAPAVIPNALAARVNESCSATATNTRRLESGRRRKAVLLFGFESLVGRLGGWHRITRTARHAVTSPG